MLSAKEATHAHFKAIHLFRVWTPVSESHEKQEQKATTQPIRPLYLFEATFSGRGNPFHSIKLGGTVYVFTFALCYHCTRKSSPYCYSVASPCMSLRLC